MSILDDAKVRQYFYKGKCEIPPYNCEGHQNCMALRVLAAMEAPIKKGERYLSIWTNPLNVKEDVADADFPKSYKWYFNDNYHPCELRLPNRFQEPKVEHKHDWRCWMCAAPLDLPPPSAPKCGSNLDSKVKDLMNRKRLVGGSEWAIISEADLGELVELVRKEKGGF